MKPSPEHSKAEMDAQVQRILAADAFRRSPKLSRFLRFVVEEAIAGRGDELKEFRIGTEVFNRGDAFDPRTDNIVRSQAHRLRALLAQYYSVEGVRDAVIIDLPRGSYVPSFRSRSEAEAAEAPKNPGELRPQRPTPKHWPALFALALIAALGLGIGLGRGINQPRGVPVEALRLTLTLPSSVRLSLDRGIGSISADGKTFVFPGVDQSGRVQLWLRSLASDQIQALPGSDDASFPFWAPDHTQVGFFAHGRLKRMRVPNGPVQVLTDAPQGRGGAWSRSGTILFASRNAELQAVAVSGGHPRAVTPTGMDYWPHFLPDGQHFLYYSRTPQSGFYLGRLNSPLRQLVLAHSEMSSVQYAAGPDKDQGWLLYLQQGALLARAFTLTTMTAGQEATPIASAIPYPPSTASIFDSAGGKALVFHGPRNIRSQPVWTSLSGSALGHAAEPGDYGELRLSPDGSQLAFERQDPELGTSDIWRLELGRKVLSRVTVDPQNELNPVWVNQGPLMLFGGGHIRATRLDRPGQVWSTQSVGGFFPQDITQDGKRILAVVTAPRRMFDLTLIGIDRLETLVPGQMIAISAEPAAKRQARLSLRGDLVAFASEVSGAQEIYVKVVSPTSVSEKAWRVSTAGGSFPLWNPRRPGLLYYLDPSGNVMQASVTSASGGLTISSPQLLFRADVYSYSPMRYPWDIAPDGERLLLNQRIPDPTGPVLQVLLNWRDLPRKSTPAQNQ